MPHTILKQLPDAPHYTKDFEGGTTSDRLILPGIDHCRVKVTRFKFKKGFKAEGIVYTYDETVLVTRGEIHVVEPHDDEDDEFLLQPGDVYHVPAGISYSVEAMNDGEAICVFSMGWNGEIILPGDD